jgi:hypothetical protein
MASTKTKSLNSRQIEVTMGERTERKRGTIISNVAFHCSRMTPHCLLIREMILKRLPAAFTVISLTFGLKVHVSIGAKPTKTEAFYYFDTDTSRLEINGILFCGSKMPSATKETPTFSRQYIWAELRYGEVP